MLSAYVRVHVCACVCVQLQGAVCERERTSNIVNLVLVDAFETACSSVYVLIWKTYQRFPCEWKL